MDKDFLNTVLNKYFTRLSNTGYVSYNMVDNLLILLFINDHIIPYSDDDVTINNALMCISGNCMVPYTSCKGSCNQ